MTAREGKIKEENKSAAGDYLVITENPSANLVEKRAEDNNSRSFHESRRRQSDV